MKKTISILLSVLLAGALALTGCGSEETTSTDTWNIGGIGPITGEAAIYGQAVKNGAQIAIDEINAAGGINGYQIEYNFQDDEHDAEKAVNAYNTLKDWGMNILMGAVTSTPCIAVAEESYSDNMFQLTPSASSVDAVKYDNAFQVCFTDPNQGISSANYISENELATKLAVIYDSSDVYSSGIYEAFVAQAEENGLDVVAEEAFTSDSNTDFTVQIQKAKDAGAELVFLPIYYQEASLILTQSDSIGYKPVFFGCDGLDGILDVEGFDTALAEGTMYLTPFAATSEDDATKSFVTAYEEAYDETPNQFAADAYDAIYIIKSAIEKADITPEDGVSAICDALKEAITEIQIDGLTGKGLSWEPTGEVKKDPIIVKVVDGKGVVLD